MNITHTTVDVSSSQWADILASWANNKLPLTVKIGEIRIEGGDERTIKAGGLILNHQHIVQFTRNYVSAATDVASINKIHAAFHAVIEEQRRQKRALLVDIQSFAARFSRWANNNSKWATVLRVITFGLIQRIWNRGDQINKKSDDLKESLAHFHSLMREIELKRANLLFEALKVKAEEEEERELQKALSQGKSRLVLPASVEMAIKHSRINKEVLFNNPIVVGDIPDVEEIDISLLINWYSQMEYLVPKKCQSQIKERFVNSVKNLSSLTSLTAQESEIITKIYKHITHYFKKKEDAIEVEQDQRCKEEMRKEFDRELKSVLYDRLARSFHRCSDRISMEAKNVYYEIISYHCDHFDARTLKNLILIQLLLDRRRVFTNIVELATEGKDPHDATTQRFFEGDFYKEFGLGSSELVCNKSKWERYAMKEVGLRNLEKREYFQLDGNITKNFNDQVVLIATADFIRERFHFQYNVEHVVNTLQELLQSQNKFKAVNSALTYQWFKENYAFKSGEILDDKGWNKAACLVLLQEMKMIEPV